MDASDIASGQLVDRNPTIDMPLRIKSPASNVPERTSRAIRDELLRLGSFSPFAYTQIKRTALTTLHRETNALECPESIKVFAHNSRLFEPSTANDSDALLNNATKDFTVLAFSSKRAGKRDVEANAYLSLGIIYDNQCKLKQVTFIRYFRTCIYNV